MKTYTKTSITTEPRLVVYIDDMTESPRSWTNLGWFITVDSRYQSPDKNEVLENIVKETGQLATSQEEHIKMIKKEFESDTNAKVVAIYPVMKYEHGYIAYNLGTAHGFDYSNNGFYIITEKTQKEVGTAKKDFIEVIEGELKVYNQFVNGEVYGFRLYDEQGELIDSCGGFYDIDDIKEYLPREWKDEDINQYIKW
jgi:hypothetical protein